MQTPPLDLEARVVRLQLFDPDADRFGQPELPEVVRGTIVDRIRSMYDHWSYLLRLTVPLKGRDALKQEVSCALVLIGPSAVPENEGVEDDLGHRLQAGLKPKVWVLSISDPSLLPEKLGVDKAGTGTEYVCDAEASVEDETAQAL